MPECLDISSFCKAWMQWSVLHRERHVFSNLADPQRHWCDNLSWFPGSHNGTKWRQKSAAVRSSAPELSKNGLFGELPQAPICMRSRNEGKKPWKMVPAGCSSHSSPEKTHKWDTSEAIKSLRGIISWLIIWNFESSMWIPLTIYKYTSGVCSGSCRFALLFASARILWLKNT